MVRGQIVELWVGVTFSIEIHQIKPKYSKLFWPFTQKLVPQFLFPGRAHHESSEVLMIDKEEKCHHHWECKANANQISLDSLLSVIVANVLEKGSQNVKVHF